MVELAARPWNDARFRLEARADSVHISDYSVYDCLLRV